MAKFACRYARSKVTLCSSALAYLPYYFYTRYPLEKTRLWNLKNLLTPTSWFAYLITILVCFSDFTFTVFVLLGYRGKSELISGDPGNHAQTLPLEAKIVLFFQKSNLGVVLSFTIV